MLFFKILLGFILFYYLFKLFFRYVMPWLLKRHIRKTQEKYYGTQKTQDKKREGEVNIDYVPKDEKGKKDELGDFVDYEEIKD